MDYQKIPVDDLTQQNSMVEKEEPVKFAKKDNDLKE